MSAKLSNKRGRPLLAEDNLSRCQALTIMTEWKIAHNREQRCPFAVKLLVGKKRLCYRHALLESLSILIANNTAQILPSPPRPKYAPVQTIKDTKP